MSALNDILNSLSLDQLAKTLGTDQDTAEQSTRQAIDSLLKGMQNNAADPGGEASLAQALENHSGSKLAGAKKISIDDVDTEDGAKVANHVLGSDAEQQVAGFLGGAAGSKLLSILAPVVMSYVAGQMKGGGFGDILGSILGQPQTPSPTERQDELEGRGVGQPTKPSLGDILGQFMGQGQAQETPSARSVTKGKSPFNV